MGRCTISQFPMPLHLTTQIITPLGAMAAATATIFLLPQNPPPKPSIPAFKSLIYHSGPILFINPLHSSLRTKASFPYRPCSGLQHAVLPESPAVAEEFGEPDPEPEKKRKLYVMNLPWTHSAPDTEKLFGECGTVQKVEIIKRENGEGRGFAFVTMASGEEALAVIRKFDYYELEGRVVRVEFAKAFKKPSPPAVAETRYQIYASNLAWEVRSTNLREFFSSKVKPVSARVVFDKQRSAGYGFVSFATEEEAEIALSELDGKELMGRPLRLRINQRKGSESRSEPESESESE